MCSLTGNHWGFHYVTSEKTSKDLHKTEHINIFKEKKKSLKFNSQIFKKDCVFLFICFFDSFMYS